MERMVIRGGTVIDQNGRRRADVAVEDGRVAVVAENLDTMGARVLDAGGCLVTPGLVDLHTHLREPGLSGAEAVEIASRAAALGGYTAVVAMPNAEPAVDCVERVRDVRAAAAGASCDVFVAASITVGRRGEQLVDLAELSTAGVDFFTDDGVGVQDAELMSSALARSHTLGITLAQHCEVSALSEGGCMHEGEWSARLGIPAVPSEAEDVMVMRDIALVRRTGGRLHFLHVSTARSVAMIRSARREGLPVTAEVTPHHLFLTDGEMAAGDAVFKVNPPLRSESDVVALRNGLFDGAVDAIATDHAPHSADAKSGELVDAAPGMLGLETALPLAMELAVDSPRGPGLGLDHILALLSWQPARIARAEAHGGPVTAGRPANLVVIDPDAAWVVEPDRLTGRATNTPYGGRKMTGRARHTLLRGEPVVIDGKAQR